MAVQNFMNVVRFKLKSNCVDKYFEVIDKTSFEGMTQIYISLKLGIMITVLLGSGKVPKLLQLKDQLLLVTLMRLEDLWKSCLLNLE